MAGKPRVIASATRGVIDAIASCHVPTRQRDGAQTVPPDCPCDCLPPFLFLSLIVSISVSSPCLRFLLLALRSR